MYLDEESSHYNAYLCDTISHWFFHLIKKPVNILDFGCGNGLLTHFIHRAFFNATLIGIDNKTSIIQKNQKLYPTIEFVRVKNTILPFQDSTFDLIYAVNVMHHIQPQEHKQVFEEIIRVLKPHGAFIAIEFNPYHWQSRKTFKKEHGSNFSMIKAHYLKALGNSFDCTIKISYLYPNLSKFESYFNKIPLGPLYALKLYKK